MSYTLLPLKNTIADVEGFYCAGVKAGLKEDDYDVGFIRSDAPCDVAALFTQNRFQAAPIKHFQRRSINQSDFLLVNSKNANAMTGDQGIADIEEILQTLPFPALNPFMSSTGVIGVRLPKEKIIAAVQTFDLNAKDDASFARSIMTTDTFEKKIGFEVRLEDGTSFKIAGVAKGAGMINPQLATMLCFIATDAAIPRADMRELLAKNAEHSFNAISVDGDTSTNDSVFLLANGRSGAYEKEAFDFALAKIMHELALLIVKDGEGAKKLVAFEVKGARNDQEAKRAAKALTNSLLVKTALFGEDPNWGRIASTIGASGVECDETSLVIAFENVVVYDKGRILFDEEQEEKAHQIMKKDEFRIICDLGIGEGRFTAYGCDLGYEYVKINAEYRT
ncbi:MAG: bifunctional ornithine acetyltransferase/N-acetylglutamate synthase [Epsilonproteobacteria bacterium]|nr:bifunctional ornithine acetyltransferase/N-acetylglutamate synthase [Campylobacterota bacterium]NPA63575.1 bifunctional glutamate N-acetyltransferase/amino-acid acetyltransferase ArgJ [Campylobacterota bacterium]